MKLLTKLTAICAMALFMAGCFDGSNSRAEAPAPTIDFTEFVKTQFARTTDDAQPANPTLRALDAVHKDYLKLHRRATKGYWAPPASPSMARSDSTPSSTPATSPSNAAAEKAAVEGAFFSQPGFWDV